MNHGSRFSVCMMPSAERKCRVMRRCWSQRRGRSPPLAVSFFLPSLHVLVGVFCAQFLIMIDIRPDRLPPDLDGWCRDMLPITGGYTEMLPHSSTGGIFWRRLLCVRADRHPS